MQKHNSTKLKLVEVAGSKLTTTSLIIAELFGKPHGNVLRALDKLKDQIILDSISYSDSYNRSQKAYRLDERSFLIAMPFIGGTKAREGQVALVDEFLRIQKLQSDPQRKAIRDETKTGFKWMNENLKESRESLGKTTKPYHYMNEAKLINGVLTGNFSGVNRDALASSDLDKIADLQRLNSKLIGQDIPYADRKAKLQAHLRAKLGVNESKGLYLVTKCPTS